MKSHPPSPHQKAAVALKVQVAEWAVRIRVKPRQVRLQEMRRKWASCSTAGTVSFSTELLSQPPAFREYVIVHELLHLKVPNHGKLFKTLLRAYLPHYESIRPFQTGEVSLPGALASLSLPLVSRPLRPYTGRGGADILPLRVSRAKRALDGG